MNPLGQHGNSGRNNNGIGNHRDKSKYVNSKKVSQYIKYV